MELVAENGPANGPDSQHKVAPAAPCAQKYAVRKGRRGAHRFCVNLSLFLGSKDRVTSSISLSKQADSRCLRSAGCPCAIWDLRSLKMPSFTRISDSIGLDSDHWLLQSCVTGGVSWPGPHAPVGSAAPCGVGAGQGAPQRARSQTVCAKSQAGVTACLRDGEPGPAQAMKAREQKGASTAQLSRDAAEPEQCEVTTPSQGRR